MTGVARSMRLPYWLTTMRRSVSSTRPISRIRSWATPKAARRFQDFSMKSGAAPCGTASLAEELSIGAADGRHVGGELLLFHATSSLVSTSIAGQEYVRYRRSWRNPLLLPYVHNHEPGGRLPRS